MPGINYQNAELEGIRAAAQVWLEVDDAMKEKFRIVHFNNQSVGTIASYKMEHQARLALSAEHARRAIKAYKAEIVRQRNLWGISPPANQ